MERTGPDEEHTRTDPRVTLHRSGIEAGAVDFRSRVDRFEAIGRRAQQDEDRSRVQCRAETPLKQAGKLVTVDGASRLLGELLKQLARVVRLAKERAIEPARDLADAL